MAPLPGIHIGHWQDPGGAARALTNTTLVAVATHARRDKTALRRLAGLAHDGLARAISPVHTAYDGHTVFVLCTGDNDASPVAIGVLAVELVAAAIRRAVREATGAAADAAADPHIAQGLWKGACGPRTCRRPAALCSPRPRCSSRRCGRCAS